MSEPKLINMGTSFTGDLSALLVACQPAFDQLDNAVLVLDSGLWPASLNLSLRKKLQAVGEAETQRAILWKQCCDKLGIIVHDARSIHESQFAQDVRIGNRVFAVLGSLLYGEEGDFEAAIINIADPRTADPDPPQDVPITHEPAMLSDSFVSWQEEVQAAQSRTQFLTKREREVSGLLVEGLGNRDIAATLGVAIKTIEKHRSNAIMRTQSRSALELVRLCTLAGIRNETADREGISSPGNEVAALS